MHSNALIREIMKNRPVITQFITNFTNLLTKISMVGLEGLDLENLNELHEILIFSKKNHFKELSEHVELLEQAIRQLNKHEMVNLYLYISNWFSLFKKQYDYMTISAEMIAESDELNLKQSVILKEEIHGIFTPLKIIFSSKHSGSVQEYECQIIGIFQYENISSMIESMKIQEKLTFYDDIFYKEVLFGRHINSNFFNLNIQNYSEYIQHTFYLTRFARDESSLVLVKLINSQIEILEELKQEFLNQDLQLSSIKRYNLKKEDFLRLTSVDQDLTKNSLSQNFELHFTPLIECLLHLNFIAVDNILMYLININTSLTIANYEIFAINKYDHWFLIDFDPFSILPPIETILTAFTPFIDKILESECSVTEIYSIYLLQKIGAVVNTNKMLEYSSIVKNKLLVILESFISTLNLLELERLITMSTDLFLVEDLTIFLTRYIELIEHFSTKEQSDPEVQLTANYFIYYCIKNFSKDSNFLSFRQLLSKHLVSVRKTKLSLLAYFLYKSKKDALINFTNFNENQLVSEWNTLWGKRHSQEKPLYEKIFLYKVNQCLYRYKIFVDSTDAHIKSIILLSDVIKSGLMPSISALEELYSIYNSK